MYLMSFFYECFFFRYRPCLIHFQALFTHVKQNGFTSSVVITSFSGPVTGVHSVSGIRSAG